MSRRGHWIPWSWSYRPLSVTLTWGLGPRLRSSTRTVLALNCGAISAPPRFGFHWFGFVLFWHRISCCSGWSWTQNIAKKQHKHLILSSADGQIRDLMRDTKAHFHMPLRHSPYSGFWRQGFAMKPSPWAITLPRPPESWDYGHGPPHLHSLPVLKSMTYLETIASEPGLVVHYSNSSAPAASTEE